MSAALVRSVMDDADWKVVLEEYGVILMAAELKRVLKQLGQEELLRANGLGAARNDDTVTDEAYDVMKRGLHAWRRSASRIRIKVRERLAEIQPAATALIDAHQGDHRALVVLAKRIWLWEEGKEDRLEEALDQFTISNDPEGRTRITLRELVERIAASGPVEA